MSRRLLLICSLLGLILAALAVLPWTLSSGGSEAMVVRQMRTDYDLQIDVKGQSTLALLPTPRIKLENVSITGMDGRIQIDGATLRGELGFWSWILGRGELTEIALSDAKINIDLKGADDNFWINHAARLRLQNSSSRARQLIIANSSAAIHRDLHPDIILDALNVAVDWSGVAAPLFLTASTSWKGKTISISKADVLPSALFSGKPSPFNLALAAAESQIDLSGTIRFDRSWDAIVSGKSSAKTASLRKLVEWMDVALPLAPLVEAVAIDGAFTTEKNITSWPSVRIKLGNDNLEGSLSFRIDNHRNGIDGTLATDNLDITRFLLPIRELLDEKHSAPSLVDLNKADLDLRLSASTSTIGKLRMADMAVSLLLKPDRFEASLSRASIDKGIAKGRLLATGPVTAREIRVQGSLDNVSITSLASAMGIETPGITGMAQTQFTLESRGATVPELLRQSHGRLALTITNGDIRGFSISDALKQNNANAAANILEQAHGNTTFSNARINMLIEAGIGSIIDGSITMIGASSELRGGVSLINQTLSLNSLSFLNKAENRTGLVIGADGPWNALRLTTHILEDVRPAPAPNGKNEP